MLGLGLTAIRRGFELYESLLVHVSVRLKSKIRVYIFFSVFITSLLQISIAPHVHT